jgi:hypothetical protein
LSSQNAKTKKIVDLFYKFRVLQAVFGQILACWKFARDNRKNFGPTNIQKFFTQNFQKNVFLKANLFPFD